MKWACHQSSFIGTVAPIADSMHTDGYDDFRYFLHRLRRFPHNLFYIDMCELLLNRATNGTLPNS